MKLFYIAILGVAVVSTAQTPTPASKPEVKTAPSPAPKLVAPPTNDEIQQRGADIDVMVNTADPVLLKAQLLVIKQEIDQDIDALKNLSEYRDLEKARQAYDQKSRMLQTVISNQIQNEKAAKKK